MMRFAATLGVPLTGLALILCPVGQADPNWTPEDWNYTKWLSEYGVNYQGRVTTNEMIAKAHIVCDALGQNPTTAALVSARDSIVKQGVLTQDEATKTSYSAISAYCPQLNNVRIP
jgi:Protein of unknown function (DUF732)